MLTISGTVFFWGAVARVCKQGLRLVYVNTVDFN
jgi:hypothetical protein